MRNCLWKCLLRSDGGSRDRIILTLFTKWNRLTVGDIILTYTT